MKIQESILIAILIPSCTVDRIPEPTDIPDAAVTLAFPSVSGPTKSSAPNAFADLVIGGMHSCVLWNDGSAHCWGSNRHGQLGDGTNHRRTKAVAVNRIANIKQISIGDGHTCALTNDGNVLCWGEESDDALGGHPEKQYGTVQVRGMGKVVEIASGYAHSCARNENDEVFCWGRFVDRGNSSASPIRIDHHFKPTRLVAAGDMNCMLVERGQIACWGFGLNEGVLPDGPGHRVMSPFRMERIDGIVDIGISAHHGCGVRHDGKVFCWGRNEAGQLGIGKTEVGDFAFHRAEVPGIDDAVQVSVSLNGGVCVRLRSGGVRCWGFDRDGQAGGGSVMPARNSPVSVPGIENAIDIGTGYDYSCAGLANGTISCWGSNRLDQLGQYGEDKSLEPLEVPGLSNAKAIAAGLESTCAVLANGSAWCWGSAGNPRESGAVRIDGITDAASAAISKHGQCIRSSDGSVSCFGGYDEMFGGDAQARPAPVALLKKVFPVQDLVFGEEHGCVLDAIGKVHCWGENDMGQVGPGARRYGVTKSPMAIMQSVPNISIAAGANESCALDKNGRVSCWGSPNYPGTLATETEEVVVHRQPTIVRGVEDALFLAHGRRHGCVIVGDGTVRCWGRNDYGQLGQTKTQISLDAVPIEGLHDIVELSLGGYFGCARQKSGHVSCWGDNVFGQIGDGTTNERRMPVEVPNLADVTHLAAGHTHTCAIVASGKVRCWGSNASGELGVGPVKSSLTPIAVKIDR